MAEKAKKTSQNPPADIFTVEELAAMEPFAKFGAPIVRAALAVYGRKHATIKEAAECIEKFIKKEIKA